ncbi:odv-e25 [Matsumuraeses phaseoli granulovirus]|uniref:Odv-e25 n=1 Tax=Matsumuraeses phaseoli granulovirus TaxID=2760664 RepID=A0AAE7SY89_9BBAC|nr:odv-e25 [Matsumuraeses phaseoli granulovirus]QOD40045.1 odv-e25 [Matsumuraeses phaseoli granulovirus]
MLGTIVLLLVIGAVLYLLWVNDKLNANSLNESSNQSGGESIQFTPDGRANVRLNGNIKTKNVRISHGDNYFSKISVPESPVRYEQLIENGDRIGANTVYLGVLDAPLNGPNVPDRSTSNFTIKKFKNLFIVFKGVGFNEIDSNNLMVRYEANKMVYALIDASNSTLPELLRDVSYPICVLTNNSSAQLVLKEWGYTQVNDSATLFVKNEKSFRLQ